MCDYNIIPFGRSNKHKRSRNVCDDNIIPFRINNKTTEKKKCV